jgi:predicted enzyme related to lactoylglutathione lyase
LTSQRFRWFIALIGVAVPASLDLTTIDAVDSEALALFWAAAVGLTELHREDGGRWIELGRNGARCLGIQRIVGLAVAPAHWDGDAKGRMHLDLVCARIEFDTELDRLIALGATELRPRRNESYGSIATLADPEGNVFDLCAYQ